MIEQIHAIPRVVNYADGWYGERFDDGSEHIRRTDIESEILVQRSGTGWSWMLVHVETGDVAFGYHADLGAAKRDADNARIKRCAPPLAEVA